MALRGPVQSRLAASLKALFSREFPNRANPVESSSTPDVAECTAPGLSANEFLKSGVRLVPI